MLELGRDVRQGDQHEPAQVQERMGDLEAVLRDDLVRVQQDVDVEGARAGRTQAGPPARTRPDWLSMAWVSRRSRCGGSSVSISTAQFRCHVSRGEPSAGQGVVS